MILMVILPSCVQFSRSCARDGRAVHPIKGKAKFGGLEVSDARRLKALEDENAKLKKLLAEQMLDMAAMKELLSKKW